MWQLWPFSPIIDEVHDVIFVDGIHLGRKRRGAHPPKHLIVCCWYAARSENSRAWGALMSRIAPPGPGRHRPGVVALPGRARTSGLPRASSAVPSTRIAVSAKPPQRAPNWRPRVACTLWGASSRTCKTFDGAQEWIGAYQAWCTRWKGFLEEKTRRPDGGWEYTHERLVRARNSLNKLISQGSCSRTWTPPGHIRCPR